MMINIWNEDESVENLTPTQKVFTLRLHSTKYPSGVLCDMAWTREDETRTHFWYLFSGADKDEDVRVSVECMPFVEYINKHLLEIKRREVHLVRGRYLFVERWRKFWEYGN